MTKHHYYLLLLLEFKRDGIFKSINITLYMDVATSAPVKANLQMYINETALYNSTVVVEPDAKLSATKNLNLQLPKVIA